MSDLIPMGTPEEEATAGAENYLAVLARIHTALEPSLYVEIGVRHGHSLRLARGPAIGIDPKFQFDPAQSAAALFEETSDAFFERHAAQAIPCPIDLAFIDGLHLFEYALRDFINIEKWASPRGLIVIDDIFPNCAVQGSRQRRTHAWTGDVWRLLICLRETRPDLILLPLDCSPSGLLLVAGIDPGDQTLCEQYERITERYLSEFADGPPAAVVGRSAALAPDHPLVGELLETLGRIVRADAAADAVRSVVREFRVRQRMLSVA